MLGQTWGVSTALRTETGQEAPQGFRLPTPWNSETTDHSPDVEKLYGILELAFTPSFVPLGAEGELVYNKGKREGSREAVLGSLRRLKGGGPRDWQAEAH